MAVKTSLLAFCQSKGMVGRDADNADVLTALAVGIAPLFFLTVKHWTNGFVLVLLVLAIHGIIREPEKYRALLADRRVLWLCGALASAFVAILISQILRGKIETSDYDGPSRALAGVLIFLHLAVRQIDFVRVFQWTCPLSVFIAAAELWLDPGRTTRWAGRWSTYFVDPLTLGQYMLLLGFLSLFMINLVERDKLPALALKIAAFLLGVAISIGTESRSAWVALPALFAIWLIAVVRIRRIWALVGSFVALAAACLLAYLLIDFVRLRIDAALLDYVNYFGGGNRDTSGGLRLSLARATWHLFLLEPLRGYSGGALPALQSIPAVQPYYTAALESALIHNGAHNEILQSMLRSGVFGLLSTGLMLAVPLVVFWSATRAATGPAYAAGVIGLGYIAAVICFGLTTETFNLKYLSSFYALMVAALGAQVIWGDPRPKPLPAGA